MLDIIISGRKSRKQKFNPNHEVIEVATNYFLSHGGKITKIKKTTEIESAVDGGETFAFLSDSGTHIARDYPGGYFD